MDRARIGRRIRELALEHAAGDLADDADLARLKALREARDAIADGSETGVPSQRAIEWLRALAESIQQADVPKERADLMHAIYEPIVVAGSDIVGVLLTSRPMPTAWRLRCPPRLLWRARQVLGRATVNRGR
jgi:hypothetical protein